MPVEGLLLYAFLSYLTRLWDGFAVGHGVFLDLHMEREAGWVILLQRSRRWARHTALFSRLSRLWFPADSPP